MTSFSRGEVDAPFSRALIALGEAREDVVVLSADLSKYTDLSAFAKVHPDRFVQVGMAEQNLIGIAAGLAKSGLTPIAVTYAVFATRRAYDQVALSLATGRRPATIVAFLPGITTPFRATHQGTDDVALMRQIPGMTVIDPMDATEFEAAVGASIDIGGPVYIRGLRGRVAQIFDPYRYEFNVHSTHILRDGDDLGIVSTGLASQWALEASQELADQVVQCSVLHVPTLKPFPTDEVVGFVENFDLVTTVENHAVTGGLGSLLAEALADRGGGPRLLRLGVPDRWAPAGSTDYVREFPPHE